ncbi:tRNA (cytosine(34)-C(5))-methyltransferase [Smittium culicis]|uniref:tRNA (Cytosine(34)-C(5))-methyltransferase n=1 Tax=Smittium culicis TaxID=133412 RepID=A0A1R1XM97_9FUNG|nr:tRNA (cytosine(34)-C(5))-methyltransferase [Smittium culicis]
MDTPTDQPIDYDNGPNEWSNEISSFYQNLNLDPDLYYCIDKLPRYARVVGFDYRINHISDPLTTQPPLKKYKLEDSKLPTQENTVQANDKLNIAFKTDIHNLTSLSSQLEKEVGCQVSISNTILGLLRISNGKAKINSSNLYKTGKIIGFDLSSAIAAISLDVKPNDHVLDLCCAPGGKLLFIADKIHSHGAPHSLCSGSVTGVDISKKRLSTCQSLIKKSKSQSKIRIRLFASDGTTFNVPPPEDSWWDYSTLKQQSCKKLQPKKVPIDSISTPNIKPFFSSKLLRNIYTPPLEITADTRIRKYNKVLVDAECSHDGSLVHLSKYINSNSQSIFGKLDSDFLSQDRLESVSELQLDLILNGWNNLSTGGTLVYSTCSLSYKQNELVIAKFLETVFKNSSR